jgi:hypothetical protein
VITIAVKTIIRARSLLSVHATTQPGRAADTDTTDRRRDLLLEPKDSWTSNSSSCSMRMSAIVLIERHRFLATEKTAAAAPATSLGSKDSRSSTWPHPRAAPSLTLNSPFLLSKSNDSADGKAHRRTLCNLHQDSRLSLAESVKTQDQRIPYTSCGTLPDNAGHALKTHVHNEERFHPTLLSKYQLTSTIL